VKIAESEDKDYKRNKTGANDRSKSRQLHVLLPYRYEKNTVGVKREK
jgi:hypothetical protein